MANAKDKWTSHVVVEGIDCSGKTTLARQIAEKLGYEYHHEGVPAGEGSLLPHYAGLLLRDTPTVFDRLHIGEVCYGPVMRGVTRMSPMEMILMGRLVHATGTPVIICQPPFSTVLERWEKESLGRKEYVKTKDKLRDIWDKFDAVPSNYSDEPARDMVQGLLYHDREEFPNSDRLLTYVAGLEVAPKDVVGAPDAKFIFVGEKCNAEPDEFHLPFFSTGGSSGYLNERIKEAGYREKDIAFTNALDIHGKEVDLTEKINASQMVIALGGVADKLLASQRIHHAMVPHPQYWKRFRNGQEGSYTAQLRDIRLAFQ